MKAKLLRTIEEGRAREAELERLVVDEPANPNGKWNAKDHLAHAAWWRERDGRLIEAVRTGSAPPPAVGSREGDVEGRQNEVIYRTYLDTPAAEIRGYAGSSWNSFTRAVEACSEADLLRPHPYAANEVLWQTALGICYHTGEHLTYWYQDTGDEAQVESAQKWLRDIYVAVAPDAKGRANANYNLACYYARNGRTEEALPPLRLALEGNEKLREWAKKDSDLDSIRNDPRVRQLVA